jgi:hypothetical protein
MSVNQRFSINPEKTQRLGKVFHTIDFEKTETYADSDYINKSKSAVCGTFFIDGKEFKLTYHELKRIQETANSALDNLNKIYKLGGMVHR